MATKATEKIIELPEIRIETVQIRLIGDSPLISNKWSEKAKKQMRDKQQKKAQTKRTAKDPDKDFKDSLYELSKGKYGFPSVAFKAAAVNACSQVEGVTKVNARAAFHVEGEIVEIEGKPTMREDMVRIAMGTTDIRYRGEFKKWACNLSMRYNADVLSADQIVHIFNVAGFGVGVGDWRPQRNGSFGMFHVATGGEEVNGHAQAKNGSRTTSRRAEMSKGEAEELTRGAVSGGDSQRHSTREHKKGK